MYVDAGHLVLATKGNWKELAHLEFLVGRGGQPFK